LKIDHHPKVTTFGQEPIWGYKLDDLQDLHMGSITTIKVFGGEF
jgi:hypothetical protein